MSKSVEKVSSLVKARNRLGYAILESMKKSIADVGGDPDEYERIKQSKANPKKPSKSNKGTSRTKALGKHGGYYNKDGSPYKPTPKSAAQHHKDDERAAPMSRKDINKSKSSGRESGIEAANNQAMGSLYSRLSGGAGKKYNKATGGNLDTSKKAQARRKSLADKLKSRFGR